MVLSVARVVAVVSPVAEAGSHAGGPRTDRTAVGVGWALDGAERRRDGDLVGVQIEPLDDVPAKGVRGASSVVERVQGVPGVLTLEDDFHDRVVGRGQYCVDGSEVLDAPLDEAHLVHPQFDVEPEHDTNAPTVVDSVRAHNLPKELG